MIHHISILSIESAKFQYHLRRILRAEIPDSQRVSEQRFWMVGPTWAQKSNSVRTNPCDLLEPISPCRNPFHRVQKTLEFTCSNQPPGQIRNLRIRTKFNLVHRAGLEPATF
ncbi:MAG TPA: hypothetical protein DCE44_22380 [Verrucomicrobiales bacterium]|nr:hypothetical protein [Verrucomicrobiales bacterium]